MSGSGASNLGYGNTVPFSNINQNYANPYNSHNPSGFGSNETNLSFGLAGAKSNIDAANSYVPGICMKGGLKRKIKNITKQYKRMKAGSRKIKKIKRRIRSRFISSHRARKSSRKNTRRRKRSRSHKGGYSQYYNNYPSTNVAQVAGITAPLTMANPPPIKILDNCTNCVDNYNHFTGKGFPSVGH